MKLLIIDAHRDLVEMLTGSKRLDRMYAAHTPEHKRVSNGGTDSKKIGMHRYGGKSAQ